MIPRALPAVVQATLLSAQPLSTGNLLADCERWCRDHLPARPGRSSVLAARRAA